MSPSSPGQLDTDIQRKCGRRPRPAGVHIVILDNGRLALAENADFKNSSTA
jgi:L-lactate utilization protein LutB